MADHVHLMVDSTFYGDTLACNICELAIDAIPETEEAKVI